MRDKKFMVILFGAMALGSLLAACGGGGGSAGSATGQTNGVSLFFTDDPATKFSSVTVTVYEVNLCSDNSCNNKVSLFSSTQGLEVDLSKLNGILQYINTANIPQGTYNRLEVVMGKNLTIVDASGNSHPAIFTPMQEKPGKPNIVQCGTNNRCYIRFNGPVQPFSDGKLIVDFVLKDFDVDTTKNPWEVKEVHVKPLKPQDQMPGYWKVYITAQSIDTQNATITGTWMGKTYTISLNQNTLCELNDYNYIGTSCINYIQSGVCLEVKTSSNPMNSVSLDAIKIETEKSYKCMNSGGSGYTYIKLKGKVVSKGSDYFTINTYSNPIRVVDNTVCEYVEHNYMRGTDCLSNLQENWYVEVKVNSGEEAIKIEKED